MSDNLGSNLHKQQKGDFSKFNYSDLMRLLNSTVTPNATGTNSIKHVSSMLPEGTNNRNKAGKTTVNID